MSAAAAPVVATPPVVPSVAAPEQTPPVVPAGNNAAGALSEPPIMRLVHLLVPAAAVLAASLFSGCESQRPADSVNPHGAPQSWEGSMSMGGLGTSNR
ncbi:MAG: hypothetical protein LBR07_08330 [Puniceicoccales bacterium]|nr:hypothetical protein [Puniceicoccales bacterium]